MIIGISGKLGSGKDTVGLIIQYLVCLKKGVLGDHQKDFDDFSFSPFSNKMQSGWEIKKMAGKLKEIASILLGVPVEKFEDRAFKESYLGPEWNYILGEEDMGGHRKMYPVNSKMHKSLEADFGNISPKRMTVREFLQKLGTDAMRDGLHPNTWANAFWADYKVPSLPDETTFINEEEWKKQNYPNWIITDVRFPNEAQSVLDHGGILIRVNRDGDTGNHPSETGLDDWEFEYTIDNNGTIEELIEKVKVILEKENLL